MLLEPDLKVIEFATPRYGAFPREVALKAGHSRKTIDYRLKTGRWVDLHPTVYVIAGTERSWHQQQIAACFWARGVSSGRAAGFLYDLPGCEDPPIEILTTPGHPVMGRCGIVVHLTKRLPQEQIVEVKGIPATSIERTIMDLCGLFDPRRAAIAMDNALFRGLTTLGSLDHCLYLTARRGRNGCGVMRKLLKKREGHSEMPNSPLETVIFEMLADSMLPMPELQMPLFRPDGSFIARPDFVYPAEKLVIEGHSKLWHTGEQKQEEDRQRDLRLRTADYLPVYLSWADATVHKERTLAMIDRFLQERRHLFSSARPGLGLS